MFGFQTTTGLMVTNLPIKCVSFEKDIVFYLLLVSLVLFLVYLFCNIVKSVSSLGLPFSSRGVCVSDHGQSVSSFDLPVSRLGICVISSSEFHLTERNKRVALILYVLDRPSTIYLQCSCDSWPSHGHMPYCVTMAILLYVHCLNRYSKIIMY